MSWRSLLFYVSPIEEIVKIDTDNMDENTINERSHPEKVELNYVMRKYGIDMARAEELVALFGNDESLIAAELAQNTN